MIEIILQKLCQNKNGTHRIFTTNKSENLTYLVVNDLQIPLFLYLFYLTHVLDDTESIKSPMEHTSCSTGWGTPMKNSG